MVELYVYLFFCVYSFSIIDIFYGVCVCVSVLVCVCVFLGGIASHSRLFLGRGSWVFWPYCCRVGSDGQVKWSQVCQVNRQEAVNEFRLGDLLICKVS